MAWRVVAYIDHVIWLDRGDCDGRRVQEARRRGRGSRLRRLTHSGARERTALELVEIEVAEALQMVLVEGAAALVLVRHVHRLLVALPIQALQDDRLFTCAQSQEKAAVTYHSIFHTTSTVLHRLQLIALPCG